MIADKAHSRPGTLAREGVNCWRIRRAERLAVLIDGAAYFGALRAALSQARQCIFIIGWDFDGRIVLARDGDRPSEALGPFLHRLVRERPELVIRLLIWRPTLLNLVHNDLVPGRERDWLDHPRLRFVPDDAHPIGAAHHQKIVVIDDRLAFAGGIDLTSGRWDTRAHAPEDPRRRDAALDAYAPVHDLQLAVSGAAAATLGDLARQRWRGATGETLPPPAVDAAAPDSWPREVPVFAADVDVAFARTAPAWNGARAIREVERLHLDMIAAARRHIYIENQYFAARRVGRALARRLREVDGPEVVVVSCLDPTNIVERAVMGLQRARLYRRLRRFDRHNRLRLLHPAHDGKEVKVHSKLAIVDDRLLRVGSANLNNRSMGLDTECDLLVDADGRPDLADAIAALRRDLLGEHLGATPAEIAAAEAEAGGIAAAVERLGTPPGRRTLVPLGDASPPSILDFAPDARLVDPDRPYESLLLDSRRAVGTAGGGRVARRLTAVAAMFVGLALLAAASPLLPVADLSPPAGPRWMAAALLVLFVIGGGLSLPASPLMVAAGALLGFGAGVAVSLAGALGAAAVLYPLGRLAGVRPRGRRTGAATNMLAFNRAGIVALLRLLPVASHGAVSLTAGMLRVRLGAYAAGTVIGTLPVALVLNLFGYLLAQALARPDMLTTGPLVILAAALAGAALGLARALKRMTVPDEQEEQR